MEFDIAPYLHRAEDQHLEYKESFQKEQIAEAVAAFSTAKGGTILVGVSDKGEPIGVKNCNEDVIQKNVFDIRTNLNDNSPNIRLHFINHSPKEKIIILQVNEGPKKPYGWKGIYYQREGSTNKKLMPDEITQLNLESKNLTFDGLKAQMYGRDAVIADLDEHKIKAYVLASNGQPRNKRLQYTTKENFVLNSNLSLNQGLKNASLLLFGKSPQEAFPNSKINFLVYESDEADPTKLKHKSLIKGDVISQINDVVGLIRAYTENKVSMDGLRRIEVNQYPLEAIREAVINAVAHRDYSIFESFINVRIFNNRLEVINPGGLVKGLTVENIKEGGLSKRRNPNICLILDNIGLMEQSGQGIRSMIESLVNAGLDEPSFTEKDNFFKVEFYSQDLSLKEGQPLVGTATDLTHALTTKQKLGLNKIQDLHLKSLGIQDYMGLSGIKNRTTAKNHLELFRELGLLTVKKRGKAWVYSVKF